MDDGIIKKGFTWPESFNRPIESMTFKDFVESIKEVVDELCSDPTFFRRPVPIIFYKGTDENGKAGIQICILMDGEAYAQNFWTEGIEKLFREYKATSFAFVSTALGYKFDDEDDRDNFSEMLQDGSADRDDIVNYDQAFLLLMAGDAEAVELWLNQLDFDSEGHLQPNEWERAHDDGGPLVNNFQQAIRKNL